MPSETARVLDSLKFPNSGDGPVERRWPGTACQVILVLKTIFEVFEMWLILATLPGKSPGSLTQMGLASGSPGPPPRLDSGQPKSASRQIWTAGLVLVASSRPCVVDYLIIRSAASCTALKPAKSPAEQSFSYRGRYLASKSR